jgi:hypothetical protein
MGLVFTIGQMEENMKVNGLMEDSMVKVGTHHLMEKLGEEYGKKAKE